MSVLQLHCKPPGGGWDLSHLPDSAMMNTIGPCFPFFALILIYFLFYPAKIKRAVFRYVAQKKIKTSLSLKFLKKKLTEVWNESESLQKRLIVKQNH